MNRGYIVDDTSNTSSKSAVEAAMLFGWTGIVDEFSLYTKVWFLKKKKKQKKKKKNSLLGSNHIILTI